MKNLSVVIVMALVAAFLFSGCTVTESPSERFGRIYAAKRLEFQMLMEDVDSVLLLSKPENTTPWAVRGGLPY